MPCDKRLTNEQKVVFEGVRALKKALLSDQKVPQNKNVIQRDLYIV